MSLQNIIKEGEIIVSWDFSSDGACVFISELKDGVTTVLQESRRTSGVTTLYSRTTLAYKAGYKAGLERAREIVGEKKAYAENLEAISESFATKGAIAVCDDIFSALSQELTKEN